MQSEPTLSPEPHQPHSVAGQPGARRGHSFVTSHRHVLGKHEMSRTVFEILYESV